MSLADNVSDNYQLFNFEFNGDDRAYACFDGIWDIKNGILDTPYDPKLNDGRMEHFLVCSQLQLILLGEGKTQDTGFNWESIGKNWIVSQIDIYRWQELFFDEYREWFYKKLRKQTN